MISAHVLTLSVALIALVAVNGDSSAAEVDSNNNNNNNNMNLNPQSITRSRTLLNMAVDDDQQPQMENGVLSPVESLFSYFPSTSLLHQNEKLYGAGSPFSQAEEDDEDDVIQKPFYVGGKRSGLNQGMMMKGNSKERYFRMFRPMLGGGGLMANGRTSTDIKRERSSVPSLSVESSLDLIRQKFLQEFRRRQLIEKQKQVESNDDFLSRIGKRNGIIQSSSSLMAKH